MEAPSTKVFTSIAANYLPKARVLARSVKRHAPYMHFSLMLVDSPPADFDLEAEPFDSLITLDDLALENSRAWAFSHTVVELCTAVKGRAVSLLLGQPDTRAVFYFDPDMVVFGRLEELEGMLEDSSILLTPHQSTPETSLDAIMDNEMASLKHGVFNMGFVGIADTEEGRRFAAWWADRLTHFCLDDIPRGLFTDQKWANLIPCFFDDYRVIRSPAFNVATWNITTREVTGAVDSGLLVNGEPLGFYHFSGFDNGDQALMLNKYGANSQPLNDLRAWYIEACEREGQVVLGTQAYGHGCYDDGTRIGLSERRLYRARTDLQCSFPDPFSTDIEGGYHGWYRHNVGDGDSAIQSQVVTLDDATQTRAALDQFSQWLGTRALRHSLSPKRMMLIGLSRLLRWLSGSAR